MASQHELAVIYAALILQDEGIAITGEKIQAILTAAGVQVEPFWPSLYAKALEGVNVKDLISNISSGVGSAGAGPAAAAAPAAAASAPAAAAAPAKKEEKKEESEDEDMGFGLFD
jgi:large subunit ribosomal protein LP1